MLSHSIAFLTSSEEHNSQVQAHNLLLRRILSSTNFKYRCQRRKSFLHKSSCVWCRMEALSIGRSRGTLLVGATDRFANTHRLKTSSTYSNVY